jgi:peptidoglycan/LPS O-acetylase OafA/YrhL
LPALFAVLLCCYIAALCVIPPKLFSDFGTALAGTVLFASNLVFWRKSANYFEPATDWSPLVHTWSLGVEEQFYIVFPLFLMLIRRLRGSVQLALVAVVAMLSLLGSIWGTANAPTATFYLLPMRAWELLIGALPALWMVETGRDAVAQNNTSPTLRALACFAGLALILFSLVRFDREMHFPGVAALVPCAGAALLLTFGGGAGEPVTRLLSLAPLRWIGKISYSLYLWHWPLWVFLTKYTPLGVPGTGAKVAILGAAAAAAWASWRWIEQPWRIQPGTRENAIQRKYVFAGAAAAAVSLGTGGILGVLGNGWPSRFPGIESVAIERQTRAESADHAWQSFSDQHRSKCFATQTATWNPDECLLTRNHATNALLWGDSFAASYAPGFFGDAPADMNIQQYTSAQCPPILDYDAASRPQCRVFNQHVMDVVRRNNITTVIMAANWSAYFNRRKLVYADIGKTVAALKAMHLHVVLVGQSPVFPFAYPDEYFYQKFGATHLEQEFYAPVTVDSDINQHILQSAGPDVDVFFDPLQLLCRDGGCLFKRDSNYLFEDFGHFSRYGSRIVVRGLLSATRALQPERHPHS